MHWWDSFLGVLVTFFYTFLISFWVSLVFLVSNVYQDYFVMPILRFPLTAINPPVIVNFSLLVLKMGLPWPLFVYFRSFQTQNLQENLWASAGFELGSSE